MPRTAEVVVAAGEVGKERVKVAGLLHAVADRGKLVREVLAAGLGGVELRARRVKCMSAHDWQKKEDSQGGHKSVTLTSDSIVMPMPRRTTRSRWRLQDGKKRGNALAQERTSSCTGLKDVSAACKNVPAQRGLHARNSLIRDPLQKADVEAQLIPLDGLLEHKNARVNTVSRVRVCKGVVGWRLCRVQIDVPCQRCGQRGGRRRSASPGAT